MKALVLKLSDIVHERLYGLRVSLFIFTGRKFCSVVMRFWLLSSHEGPEDPEGSKIFKVAPSEEAEGPQRKIATAVYE